MTHRNRRGGTPLPVTSTRFERLVDESYELADRALVELPGAPPWHYYRSPAFWGLERGRALYMVPGRAMIHGLPGSANRWVENHRSR